MNSELDRIFEQGLSKVTRSPKVPLSDEQIAAAAKESKSGAAVWLRMHAKEILLCAVLLSVGIAGTLLVTHFTGNQESAPKPAETVAAVVCDTTMGADDTDVLSDGPATTVVETHGRASLQTDQPANTSAKHDTEPAVFPVVVKKTIVQRDTVVINETVTIKDTVYLMDD